MRLNTLMKGVAAVAVIAATTVASFSDAEARVRMKIHSAFGKNIAIIGPGPHHVADAVGAMSDGEVRMQVFEPGALVPGTKYFDPVSTGSIDGAWGTPGYNVHKNFAYAFFSAVPFGPRGGEYLAWMRHGGGQELADEMYGRDNIKMFVCNLIPPESSGWFRQEINSLDDLKGLKMRFFGLGAKVMEKFGVSTQLLAGGDIYPALEAAGALGGAGGWATSRWAEFAATGVLYFPCVAPVCDSLEMTRTLRSIPSRLLATAPVQCAFRVVVTLC